jgi:hypothetical protein
MAYRYWTPLKTWELMIQTSKKLFVYDVRSFWIFLKF